ncbi:hypothetical protein IC006_0347 [Sulfuracidifex tepidarius]|uniref:DUF4352 domain-containing protein n=1 Tax=Sulfuracidifex tepidarius TaxID=1294262 RepID=A0A510DSB4_9CREN|nr:hypothetical protein [Sulfuracidifex tepidarius]BBG23063.1 hypothetical protein IC006_0347 [Sulfuracidifex tepidarius]
MSRKKIVIFLISSIAIIGIVLTTYPVIQSLVSPQQVQVAKSSYGTFPLCVYSSDGTSGHLKNVTGIMLTINNENDKGLNLSCIENSTNVIHINYVYVKQQVINDQGDLSTGFMKEGEVFIGEETIVIPVKLSPGVYTLVFSDGNYFQVNIS